MSVLTHVAVGTNDLEKARSFHDKVLGALGLTRMFDEDHRSFYGKDGIALLVTKPINGAPAVSANGGTVGLSAPSREAVRNFHAEALANGGTCEGEPGLRPFAPNAYGAYVRDPDGNKFCAYCYAAE